MRVLKETDKFVIYTDGDRTYLCKKEKFNKNHKESS